MQFDLTDSTSLAQIEKRLVLLAVLSTQLPLLAYLAFSATTGDVNHDKAFLLALAGIAGAAVTICGFRSVTKAIAADLPARKSEELVTADPAPALDNFTRYSAMTASAQVDDFNIAMHEDRLTGIANQRGFQAQVDALPQAKRQGCMVLIDIDHFDQISEHLGEMAANRTLCDFAARLSSQTRRVDIVGRWQGERFAVFYQDCMDDEASWALARIAERIRKEPLGEVNGRPITFSAGLCRWRGEPVSAVMARANEALFRAGQSGRNQVLRADAAIDGRYDLTVSEP